MTAAAAPLGRAAPTPQVAGTTVISWRQPGSTRLHVPNDVTIDNPLLTQTHDLQIRHPGDFAGFALVAEGDRAPRSMFFAGSSPTLADGTPFVIGRGELVEPSVVVPAGTYRLFGFGNNVRVTLRLDDLGGSQRVRLADRSDAEVAMPELVRDGNLYAAGGVGRLEGDGFLLALTWDTSTTGPAAAVVDFCQSRGPIPEDWLYLPGQRECEMTSGYGGGETWGDHALALETTPRLYHAVWEPRDSGVKNPRPGVYQQTVTMETASGPARIDGRFVWLTY